MPGAITLRILRGDLREEFPTAFPVVFPSGPVCRCGGGTGPAAFQFTSCLCVRACRCVHRLRLRSVSDVQRFSAAAR